jgi:23S rRNA (cytidine1920-2'-O)/16S rRNA (cytidine1409-2'-O)-methyltransferase
MRADQLLVERGLAVSRSLAQRLIASGVHWRLPGGVWKAVSKNGEELRETVELQLADAAEARFVSRGGLKLAGALDHVSLDVAGLRCLDVGQSTGGFTDCLLQRGAAAVVGLDVGQGQMHPRLRGDARVV